MIYLFTTLSGFCTWKGFLSVSMLLILYSGILCAQNNSLNNDVDLLLLKEKYKEAENTINMSLVNSPGTAELYYRLGVAYQKQYLYGKAIDTYSKSIALDTNMTSAYLSLGDCFIELGLTKKALSIYEKVFDSDSTNIKAGLNLASIFLDQKDYQQAFYVYKKISRVDPSNSYLYRQLGYCTLGLDSIMESNEYYRGALKLNDNDMISLQQLINNLLKLKWNGNAFYILMERIKKDPDNSLVLKLLGDTFFNDIKYEDAITEYSKSLSTGDTTAYLLQKLGISYYMSAARMDSAKIAEKDSTYRLAASILEKAKEMDVNPVTYYYLALANQKLGNYNESLKYFNQVLLIAIPSITSDLYIHMSESYLALNDYSNMINSYNAAFLFNPTETTLLLNIAEVYENKLFDNPSAAVFYKEYLTQNPQNNEVTSRVRQKLKELSKKK